MKLLQKILNYLVLIVLVAAILANGLFVVITITKDDYPKASETEKALSDEEIAEQERIEKEEEKWEEQVQYIPGENASAIVIQDEDEVIDALEELRDDLGIPNPEDAYYVSNKAESSNIVVYTLQRRVNGSDVMGDQLRVVTDKEGKLLTVSGEYKSYSLPETDVAYSEYDCYDVFEDYMENTQQIDLSDIHVTKSGLQLIYFEEDSPTYCYVFDCARDYGDSPYRRVFVDANTKEVVSDISLDVSDMETVSAQGQIGSQTLSAYKNYDGSYTLKDVDRKIYVARAEDIYFYPSNPNRSEITWGGSDTITVPDPSAIDAYANIQKIYECYQTFFGRTGITNDPNTDLNIYTNVGYWGTPASYNNFVNNAAMSGTTTMIIGQNTNGSPDFASCLDVLGHEFFHGVTRASSSVYSSVSVSPQESEQFAIGEGLADIFGEIAEDGCDTNAIGTHTIDGSCNWDLGGVRDLSNPSTSTNANDFINGQTNCHYGAPVISYPFYLLYSGEVIGSDKKIDIEVLTQFYYDLVLNLTGTVDFEAFRKAAEEYALLCNTGKVSLTITDEQLEGIIDAMDHVGIKNSYAYSITPDAKMEVYDTFGELYTDYHLDIYKYDKKVVSQDVDDDSYKFSLDPGIYRAVLTDNDTDMKHEFSFIVNDNSANQRVDEYKDYFRVDLGFGKKPVQVPMVLDTSGSMQGDAIAETKIAGANFINNVLKGSKNAYISLVTFSDDASTWVKDSRKKAMLNECINSISAGGSTNIYDALETANELFDQYPKQKKVMLLMGDGLPTEGKGEDEIIALANEMKADDVTIYCLGFFHNSSGSDLTNGISLLSNIASPGYYYNVQDGNNIGYIFDEMSQMINGKQYIYIRLECPIEVSVTKGDETLSSAVEDQNLHTSFGSLTFEELEDGEVAKVLRLENTGDYELCIDGTGTGKMDMTVSYPNEDGEYDDEREFRSVPIKSKTKAFMNTAEAKELELQLDQDGDGIADKVYVAKKNRSAKVEESKHERIVKFHKLGLLIAILLLVVLTILTVIKDAKKKKLKRQLLKDGTISAEDAADQPRKKFRWIPQVIVIAVCLLITHMHGMLFASDGATMVDQLRQGQYQQAELNYKNNVRKNKIVLKYTDLLVDRYLDDIEARCAKGEISEKDAEDIITKVEDIF